VFLLGQDYALHAEFFRRKGEPTKAQENLMKAIEIMKECAAEGWAKKYEERMLNLR
jgi:hypothetical protein